jgi:hypothetical protein
LPAADCITAITAVAFSTVHSTSTCGGKPQRFRLLLSSPPTTYF